MVGNVSLVTPLCYYIQKSQDNFSILIKTLVEQCGKYKDHIMKLNDIVIDYVKNH